MIVRYFLNRAPAFYPVQETYMGKRLARESMTHAQETCVQIFSTSLLSVNPIFPVSDDPETVSMLYLCCFRQPRELVELVGRHYW